MGAAGEVVGGKRPIGRPSDYTPELGELICERMIEGDGASLRTVLKADDMPVMSTVLRWLARHQEFSAQYARAIASRADLWAEQIVDISDDEMSDVQRAKLRVDTRKWLMAKCAAKKYGDRAALEVSDPNGNPLAGTTINALVLPPARAAQVREIARQALLGEVSDS